MTVTVQTCSIENGCTLCTSLWSCDDLFIYLFLRKEMWTVPC